MSARILVVEDNPANMKLVRLLLEMASYQVLEAEDAPKGIEIATAEMPDLVLMDIQLPGMDGLEAVRRLRANPATRDLKIIALTAFAMKGDESRMIEAGCNGYIAKPIQYQEFLQTVSTILASIDEKR